MLELFDRYREAGKLIEAVLVGRNLFNRAPSDEKVFAGYYDLLCQLAENLPSFAEREDFAGQAGIALAFFSENVEINEEAVAKIAEYRARLDAIEEKLHDEAAQREQAEEKAVKARNGEKLKALYKLCGTLRCSAEQADFDRLLLEMREIDCGIDQDDLTEEQRKDYETLTKTMTELVSEKMREFEYKSNVDYNKKAAAAYAEAFKKFRENEGKYKNETQLFALASKTLFAYDASRLFNETLIYYNHVYSYIFSKLDDDGKLALTRFSIECERKLK